jgi:hypothetical protein
VACSPDVAAEPTDSPGVVFVLRSLICSRVALFLASSAVPRVLALPEVFLRPPFPRIV